MPTVNLYDAININIRDYSRGNRLVKNVFCCESLFIIFLFFIQLLKLSTISGVESVMTACSTLRQLGIHCLFKEEILIQFLTVVPSI